MYIICPFSLLGKLQIEAGGNNIEASDAGDVIDVLFPDTNRYYEVDKNGKITGPNEVVNDENAGDITKGGRCDGSEEKPYEISCIEDLVAFSNLVNGSGIKLKNGQKIEITKADSFGEKYVILTRSLNFKSKYSYKDSKRVEFGDINNDGVVENLLVELTKEDENCTGFTPIGITGERYEGFDWATFDGKNNEIKNIYINTPENAGLFGGTFQSTIKNITVSGSITSIQKSAGGIVADGVASSLYNCHNLAAVSGNGFTGGIGGRVWNPVINSIVENCSNSGEISSKSMAAGIIGDSSGEIKSCYNTGKVSGASYTGGIVGESQNKLIITKKIQKMV